MPNAPYNQDKTTGNIHLHSPTAMPDAGGFLWNKKMMIQMNCRGYATAQFMQPEPAKYAKGPTLEATGFMQPEHPYFAHHPGRFFYVRDNKNAELFSAPYEPVRAALDKYEFINSDSTISWLIERSGLRLELELSLTAEDAVELWSLRVSNFNGANKSISLFPYFPLGYMSWMNQSATFSQKQNAVIGSCITPYQKVEQYFKNQDLQDKTFLIADTAPHAWLANQRAFEGEGGLSAPDALKQPKLENLGADYEMPAAVMQFDVQLKPGESQEYRFLFGPAKDSNQIAKIKNKYFTDPDSFDAAKQGYRRYIAQSLGTLEIETPDADFDNFVNTWLPRQTFYHGDVNRLTTDPQTRNYLQDHLGMTYIKPAETRASFITALSQQKSNGEMPDGILLRDDAELKYINQVPHADHNIWLPICLKAYLDETADFDFLDVKVPYIDNAEPSTVKEHICAAMAWLYANRDERGLSFIAQGDWCDPMNMVGYKGKGVSGWLTMATSFAFSEWATILEQVGHDHSAKHYRNNAEELNGAINEHLWDGNWYARGITDEGNKFGVANDPEGRIFLNAQSWAILCGAATPGRIQKILVAVSDQLSTPYGPLMLAPAYTSMREDVGRVTQKHPGSAENGSVYNHAAIFFIYALYQIDASSEAFRLLKQMLPINSDALQRGQLPSFVPNYYRGAYYQLPRTAGKSSQLFNTGTVAWYYRCVIEGLFGLRGEDGALLITPNLPESWNNAKVKRTFLGANFNITIARSTQAARPSVLVDGKDISDNKITDIAQGQTYEVSVTLPPAKQALKVAS
jgi:cellobionic acid phosphorylase